MKTDQKTSTKQGIFFKKVYAQVKKIPYGKVASYGDIAAQIGFKRYARHVGYALNAVKTKDKIPWHRVVNAQGKISIQKDSGVAQVQKMMLEDEGVKFEDSGKINMKVYRWLGDSI